MSQDIRRERAGVRFETIAGASDYIARLEAENRTLRHALAYAAMFSSFDEDVDLVVQAALKVRNA